MGETASQRDTTCPFYKKKCYLYLLFLPGNSQARVFQAGSQSLGTSGTLDIGQKGGGCPAAGRSGAKSKGPTRCPPAGATEIDDLSSHFFSLTNRLALVRRRWWFSVPLVAWPCRPACFTEIAKGSGCRSGGGCTRDQAATVACAAMRPDIRAKP